MHKSGYGRGSASGFVFATFLILLSCDAGGEAGARLQGDWQKGPTVTELLADVMPQAMADGVLKVAVVRNLTVVDHSRQFLEGCVAEGRALGFTVDTFVTGGDRERARELMGRIAAADYDGIILSNGDADFSRRVLEPVLVRGLKVVTFDALPFRDGDPAQGVLPGVTSTEQNDEKLARISLNALLTGCEERGRSGPGLTPRIIRVWYGPGIPPLDRRQAVYDTYVRDGIIKEVAWIGPRDFTFSRSGVRDALTAILPRFPPGTVDAIWAPYDEFAVGCVDALKQAGREDITLTSIDISSDDIDLMTDHPSFWIGAAALDPRIVGIVNMRLLAAKLAGEQVPDTLVFDVTMVMTSSLSKAINMWNLATVVPGWDREQGLFGGYPWMAELKAAAKRSLRLQPRPERSVR